MNDWTRICALTDIPQQGARVAILGGVRIAVFRTADDEVYAIRDACPHKGGPLSQGIVFDKRVSCPLHGWTIRLDNGEAVAPDVGCAHIYPVRIDNGDVYVGANAGQSPVAAAPYGDGKTLCDAGSVG
jgi:nitrite reductase (NADH) small subunit